MAKANRHVTCDRCGREADRSEMRMGLFETHYCVDNPDCEYPPSLLTRAWRRLLRGIHHAR